MSKEKQETIEIQIMNYLTGKYDAPDVKTQCTAGWYDWFCQEKSLAKKTDTLYKKLLQIIRSKKFDIKSTYVLFKNNCPMAGKLYDDFRICDIKTGDVLYTVTPSSGHTGIKGQAEIWGKENDFKEAIVEGTWKDVLRYFLT